MSDRDARAMDRDQRNISFGVLPLVYLSISACQPPHPPYDDSALRHDLLTSAQAGEHLQKQIEELRGELSDLSTRIDADRLTQRLERVAFLTPGSSGYSAVRYDLGVMTVSLDDVAPYANGSKITLKFGNTSGAAVSGLRMRIDWGSVDEQGAPLNDQAKTKEYSLMKELKRASWTKDTVVLEGVPPAKLGFVRVHGVSHTGIELTR